MDFKEAYEKANDEDSLRRKAWEHDQMIEKSANTMATSLTVESIFSDDWEVIKVEPKVFTAEEWLENQKLGWYYLRDDQKEIVKPWINGAFEDGHENGRLERDLEVSPLIEAIRNFLKTVLSSGGTPNELLAVQISLENLKLLE